jgi:cyanophycinase
VTDGTVIIIGGAEDKVRDRVILGRFATLAGGADGIIVVISTASSLGALAG